mmetsp:Transcript_33489/g.59037  ORF Transcript_33489/g.59037 Transcript_33489/m.59037 type:complete len:227 (-) Transcript_33489:376-1056(-)
MKRSRVHISSSQRAHTGQIKRSGLLNVEEVLISLPLLITRNLRSSLLGSACFMDSIVTLHTPFCNQTRPPRRRTRMSPGRMSVPTLLNSWLKHQGSILLPVLPELVLKGQKAGAGESFDLKSKKKRQRRSQLAPEQKHATCGNVSSQSLRELTRHAILKSQLWLSVKSKKQNQRRIHAVHLAPEQKQARCCNVCSQSRHELLQHAILKSQLWLVTMPWTLSKKCGV